MTLIVDSYAWIEILLGSATGSRSRDAMADAGDSLTPDLVLAEIARKFAREGCRTDEVRRHLKAITAASEIVAIDTQIALGTFVAYTDLQSSARARGLDRPGLADAIILATGRSRSAQILTGDPHFEGLAETLWVGE